MALKHLTDEQVRTWSLEQKDRWWFENVWRGDMPQLTVRSALTGMFIGSTLSLTNLYVGAKTGWSLGVGITSVVLAFAMFKVLSGIGLGKEFTILENNCMQSIATAAGYMTSPMISSLAAYMMVTKTVIPMQTTLAWIIAISLLGVLFAFPLKRRFINDEQHPFPEGRAAGVVMDALHTGHPSEGLVKARILVVFGAFAAVVKLMSSQLIMAKLKLGAIAIPEYLDGWFYKLSAHYLSWTPKILGTDLRELTVRPDSDIVMMAAGGLMGIRVGVSLLLGAVVNYCVLAPWMIRRGDIEGQFVDGVMTYGFRPITTWALWCGVAMMTTASLFAFFSRPQVLVSAFRGLFSRQKFNEQTDVLRDIELPMRVFVIGIPVVGGMVVYLAHRFFGVGVWLGALAIPLIFLFTLIAVNSTALTSITPISAVAKLTQLTYSVIAPRNITTNLATAAITGEVASNASNLLMDIKPGYMLGAKPRQQAIGHVLGIFAGALASVPVFYLVFLQGTPLFDAADIKDPQGLVTALRSDASPVTSRLQSFWQGAAIPPSVTNSVSTYDAETLRAGIADDLNSLIVGTAIFDSETLSGMDLSKEGRALAEGDPQGKPLRRLNRLALEAAFPEYLDVSASRYSANEMVSEEYPMPAAIVWRAVAEILTEGISKLELSARWAALLGALLGITLEAARAITRGRFWLSGVGVGLAFVIPFNTCFSMFLGSFFFWVAGRSWRREDTFLNRIFVKNLEPVCAGVIAGGALMGIAVILLETFVLS